MLGIGCYVWCCKAEWVGTVVIPSSLQTLNHSSLHHHHNRFTALFPGPPGWAGARRELLDFMVQGKINRGRHTDHPAEHHSIRTNQCPPLHSPHIFYRPDALPAAQPTVSKHWRQLAHSQTLEFSSTVLLHQPHSILHYGTIIATTGKIQFFHVFWHTVFLLAG